MKFRRCSLCSVADPHHIDTDEEPDPDPACNIDGDPDPACYFDADPIPSF
jgi:hypothetical protein